MSSFKTLPGVVALAATLLFTSLLPATAQAQTANRWIGGTSGNWFAPGNWSNGALPAAYAAAADPNSTAQIDDGSVVTLAGGVTVEATAIKVVSSTLEINDVSLNLRGSYAYGGVSGAGGSADLVVGSAASGAAGLVRINGATLRGYYRSYINDPRFGTATEQSRLFNFQVGILDTKGKAIIEGLSDVQAAFTVGSIGGTGTLEVRGGATISGSLAIGYMNSIYSSETVGQGQVLISGAGTTALLETLYMSSGNNEGSLTIEQGAKVTVTSNLSGGYYKSEFNAGGGTGVIRITGAGTELNVTSYLVNGDTLIKGTTMLGVTGYMTLIIADGASFSTQGGAVTLGAEKGQIYFGDPYSYDSKGVLQIGEGGAAGAFLAPEVTTGYGSGEVIFNHNESNYTFAANITEKAPVRPYRDFYDPEFKEPGKTAVHVRSGGTTHLTGASTYSGGTFIDNGTLIAGSERALGWGTVNVASGSRLLVAPGVTTLKLGNVVTLTYPTTQTHPLPETVDIHFAGNLLVEGGSTLEFTVGADSLAAPRIEITGSFSLESSSSSNPWNLVLHLPDTFDFGSTYDWTFLTTTAGLNGFDPDNVSINLEGWSISAIGNDLVLSYAAVPEPGRLLLLATSLATILLRRRRREGSSRPSLL